MIAAFRASSKLLTMQRHLDDYELLTLLNNTTDLAKVIPVIIDYNHTGHMKILHSRGMGAPVSRKMGS